MSANTVEIVQNSAGGEDDLKQDFMDVVVDVLGVLKK